MEHKTDLKTRVCSYHKEVHYVGLLFTFAYYLSDISPTHHYQWKPSFLFLLFYCILWTTLSISNNFYKLKSLKATF